MAERINVYRLRELSDVVAAECDLPLAVDIEKKTATLSVMGFRDEELVAKPVYSGSIREAHAFLRGIALATGIDVGAL